MPAPRSRLARLLAVALAAAAGGALTYTLVRPFVPDPPAPVQVLPYPHHIPKTPGGVSLRFAMVQDVLHERFARHGPAYYAERNRLARAELAALQPGDRRDSLSDDLGAGLDHLGEHDEAVRVLRAKLESQTARGVTGRGLYTTYANLGTFLIHGSFRAAQAGDAAARERLSEGHGYIRKAIDVNPDAHFGREQWQAAAVEFLLAALNDPKLLRTFDLIGNRFDADVDPRERRVFGSPGPAGADEPPFMKETWLVWGEARSAAIDLRLGSLTPEKSRHYRGYITPAGAETGWPLSLIPSHPKPVPFD